MSPSARIPALQFLVDHVLSTRNAGISGPMQNSPWDGGFVHDLPPSADAAPVTAGLARRSPSDGHHAGTSRSRFDTLNEAPISTSR